MEGKRTRKAYAATPIEGAGGGGEGLLLPGGDVGLEAGLAWTEEWVTEQTPLFTGRRPSSCSELRLPAVRTRSQPRGTAPRHLDAFGGCHERSVRGASQLQVELLLTVVAQQAVDLLLHVCRLRPDRCHHSLMRHRNQDLARALDQLGGGLLLRPVLGVAPALLGGRRVPGVLGRSGEAQAAPLADDGDALRLQVRGVQRRIR